MSLICGLIQKAHQFVHHYGGKENTYSIPEFINQPFNPLEPYKIAVRASGKTIDENFIKLAHEGLEFGSILSYLKLEIEHNDTIVYAITNDPSLDGTDYKDIQGRLIHGPDGNVIKWSSDLLLGIDTLSGIVHIDAEVKEWYEIYGTYTYKEIHYTLSSLNLNPIFSTYADNEIKAIYVILNTGD